MRLANLWIVLTILSVNCRFIECTYSLNTDTCLKDPDHNRVIFKKCLIPKLYEVIYLNFRMAQAKTEIFQRTICGDIRKSFKCVGYMGGFCPNQDNLGPNLLKYLNHLCTNRNDFSDVHNVVRRFISLTSDQFSSISQIIDPCLRQVGQEAHLEKCLLGENQCDSNFKFTALEDSYVCVMTALQEIQVIDMDELLKATNLLVNMLDLEIPKDPFCKSKVPMAKKLCKSGKDFIAL